MKPRRTPQEKKALSYAKDGRNAYAESRSKSRKGIAQRKASAHRALRRAEAMDTARLQRSPSEIEAIAFRAGRKSWRKNPDAPLAEYVDRTIARRVRSGMNQAEESSPLLQRGKRAARHRRVVYKGPLRGGSDG